MPGILKTDPPTSTTVDKDSKTSASTSPTDSKPSAIFPGLSLAYEDRFLRSILKPKDPSFDAHRRTIFLNLRENTLAAWHKLALEGRQATEEEEAELVKSEMQLRKMDFGYLDQRQGGWGNDRTVCSIRNNERMWRALTQEHTPEDLNSDEKLRESLVRYRATEALQTQTLVSRLRIGNPTPFDRDFLVTLRESHIQLVKAEADRLRDRRRVEPASSETVNDMIQRRKDCEEWFGGVFVWPKDDGKSAFAFLDECKPSTPAFEDGAQPIIKVECVVDAMEKMTMRDIGKKA